MRLADCGPPWRLPPQRAAAITYGAAEVREGQVDLVLSNSPDWNSAMVKRLGEPGQRRVLLYIHGYKNSAEFSLARADEVAKSSGFTGAVVAYLWPSHDSTLRYTWDENENLWAMREARSVLAQLAESADEVVLVAHSMGNRIALDALAHLQRTDQDAAAKVRRLVLASPDVDAAIFANDLAEIAPGRTVTVYASARDRALRSSRTVHGRRRAGDLRCRQHRQTQVEPCPFAAVANLVQIVDTQPFNTSLLGHANFIESPEVAADMCRIIRGEPLYRKYIDGNVWQPAPEAVPADEICRALQESRKH